MKFLHLGLRERFEFEGEVYTKSSPMIATRERDGSTRAIARSANVRPLDGTAPVPVIENPTALPVLYQEARALIAGLPVSDETARTNALVRLDAIYHEATRAKE
ncbi:MAG: hypothetical protein H6980_05510 [Gammaproteobacteria bacterium]|nr:hypothetical protein [Gammaproteobacteria bacterium]